MSAPDPECPLCGQMWLTHNEERHLYVESWGHQRATPLPDLNPFERTYCDHCAEGNEAEAGWHEYRLDAAPFGEALRIPCALDPPEEASQP